MQEIDAMSAYFGVRLIGRSPLITSSRMPREIRDDIRPDVAMALIKNTVGIFTLYGSARSSRHTPSAL